MTEQVAQKKLSRTITGDVISNKGEQTITVRVVYKKMHPLYRKYIKRSTTVRAHDPDNSCQIGDVVMVQECRPISKTKTWALVEIKERARA